MARPPRAGILILERSVSVLHMTASIGTVRLSLNDSMLRKAVWTMAATGAGLVGLTVALQFLLQIFLLNLLLRRPFATLEWLVKSYAARNFSPAPTKKVCAKLSPLVWLLLDMDVVNYGPWDLDGVPHILSILHGFTPRDQEGAIDDGLDAEDDLCGRHRRVYRSREQQLPWASCFKPPRTWSNSLGWTSPKSGGGGSGLGGDSGGLHARSQAGRLHRGLPLRRALGLRHNPQHARLQQPQCIPVKGLRSARHRPQSPDHGPERLRPEEELRLQVHLGVPWMDDELPEIKCTKADIEEVLLKMLRNAAQAMAENEP